MYLIPTTISTKIYELQWKNNKRKEMKSTD